MKVTKLKVNKTTVKSFQFSSVLLLSHVWLFATLWTTAHQASPYITKSWSFLKLMSIESVMPSNHLILYCPLLLLPSIFPQIRVFSNESVLHIRWPKYWSFSFNISSPNEYSGLISFRMEWFDVQSSGFLCVSSHYLILPVKKAEHQRTDAFELWCWRRLLRVPWTARRSKPVHPKGDQSWLFIGRTAAEAGSPILWPPDVKNWLIWKDPDGGKDWRQEEKGMTEDETVGWHHQLNGHEFE